MLIFNWFAIGSFFLMFNFLMAGLTSRTATDPFFGSGVAMTILMKQVYLISVIVIFVASLGNRPQGSRLMYTFGFVLFAIIMICMTYVSGFLIHLAVVDALERSQVVNPDGTTSTSVSTLTRFVIEEPAFRNLVLSIGSTIGAYLLASIIYLDPWHMLTSFIQYTLLLPSFVNILMVYALCNLHDVSWGTKGILPKSRQRRSKYHKIQLVRKWQQCIYRWIKGTSIKPTHYSSKSWEGLKRRRRYPLAKKIISGCFEPASC